MQIILPPSETKRPGGVGLFDPDQLRNAATLGATRAAVRRALEELGTDPELAAKTLKLGVKNRAELEYNDRLSTSGVLPAVERYTGVLYDALDVPSLDGTAMSWIHSHVLIQSALFGLIRSGDQIPAYRLSASTRLAALELPLARSWREAHQMTDWSQAGFVLDMRSKDYGALAPLPGGVGHFLHVAQLGENGEVRALNHFNKAAKGDLVRRLALTQPSIRTLDDFLAWGTDEGLEITLQEETGDVTLLTNLGAPRTNSA